MVSVKSLLIRTDITSIKCYKNYILVGIGGQLHILEKTKLLNIITVFDGAQIFGIVLNDSSTRCLVYGENRIKILACNFLENNFVENASYSTDDWILSAKWINTDDNVATVSMHNKVLLLSKDLKLIEEKSCKEDCILYCSHLVNYTWNELIVLSGTVFSQILIWWPSKTVNENTCPVLFTLAGHKGVIFSIHYNPTLGLICSTSDDRSAKLWTVQNKDLAVELMQSEFNIHLKCSMYGHTARVFRCLILDKYVLTAGEDSLVNIWDLDGHLLRKLDAQGGGSVWALDYDQDNNMIAAAGGDCGVTLFALNQNIDQQEISVINDEVLKKIVILNNGNFVGISETGILLIYVSSTMTWRKVNQHDDLISYALLQVWKPTNTIALAGYHGSVHIYVEDTSTLTHICSYTLPNKSRIFSLHWLSENNFLTCEAEGVLSLWLIKSNTIVFERQFRLPTSKERWTTCACYCGHCHIAVGDRKGNVYLYFVESIDPVQIIKKAHDYLGITNLYFKNDNLTSLGRNSIIRRYKFNLSKQLLSPLSSDKVPLTWTAAICDEDKCTLLLAFLGNQFVVWDYRYRRTLLEFECGGAHRSWDFFKLNDILKFVFIQKKKIHMLNCDLKLSYTTQIMERFHFNEINSGICIQLPNIDKVLLISGGEDTVLRFTTIEYGTQPLTLKTRNVFKSHLSSIRAITSCKINTDAESEKHLVFSAGGRAQIILWELELDRKNSDVAFDCSEKHSHYETLPPDESETRIMDLCCITLNSLITLIAASSNGNLRVFLISLDKETNYKMVFAGEVIFKLRCILKVRYLKIHNQDILLSACTRGELTFWNFTKFNTYVDTLKNFDKCTLSNHLQKINAFHSFQLHSGGINSIDYRRIDSNRYILLTGGDDNTIVVNLLAFTLKDSKLCVDILSTFHNSDSHCAQITGVLLVDTHFLTISIDQKLNTFKWLVENDDILCEFITKYNTNIPDVHGIQAFEKQNVLQTVMYGRGLEVCEVLLK